MGARFVVLGAGRQGTAAAYDLVLNAQAERVLVADADSSKAREALARLRKLLAGPLRQRRTRLDAARLDATRRSELVRALKGADAVLSALPYPLNPGVAAAAVAARAHYCDLGGSLDAARRILKLDRAARRAGVTLIPDCGLAPGLCNTLAVAAMEKLPILREVRIYCGGLPQKPRPPLGYKIVFSLDGLLASYFGKAFALRKGAVAAVTPFAEREELDFGEPVGRLEAFTTAGGASTCPWSFAGRVQTYEYKTLRYPGHFEKVQTLKQLGLLDEKPVPVAGHPVSPRDLFRAVAAPRLAFPDDRDLVVLRVAARGQKEGKNVEIAYDLLDFYDPKTRLTAMERTTGFSLALVAEMLAQGVVRARGAVPLEKSVPGRAFLEEIRKRGIRVTETIRVLDGSIG